MSIITFDASLQVVQHPWGQQRNDMAFRSSFGAQGVELSSPLWVAALEAPPMNDADPNTGAWQSLLMLLDGQVNQLELWNIVRPAPLGTMRGTMILTDDIAQGATTAQIQASGQGGKTLLKGDYLGFGSGVTQQVIFLTADAIADVSGNISVNFKPAARNTILTGSPPAAVVTWDKPKALFRQKANPSGWNYSGGLVNSIRLDLIEDWRPS